MTVVGTRPEIIRLSRIIHRMQTTPGIDHVLVHTGQNRQPQLRDVFFAELGVPAPDHDLAVPTTSLGAILGGVLTRLEPVLEKERPDAFLVLGDTNSALSLILARRTGITTYHLEAGNRCFDDRVPEEVNRRLLDHTADHNLAYTEHARRNLLAEGLAPDRVTVIGSPLNEVLTHYRAAISDSPILGELGLSPGGYFLVSAHRQETVDSPAQLALLVEAINAVAARWSLPVVMTVHPRTRQRLAGLAHPVPAAPVRLCEPFGFQAYNHLQQHAACVLSDSGSVSEEAALLRFPAVTLRSAIERPEALEAGVITLTGLRPDRVVAGVDHVMARTSVPPPPADYLIPDTSSRVVNLLLSTAGGLRRG